MSGQLNHAPSEIIRKLLIDLGLGTLVSSNGEWPVYDSSLPDSPDNAIVVTDTAPVLQGREMVAGEVQERHGIQVRVRSADVTSGYIKANRIAVAFDQEVYDEIVILDYDVYSVHAISRTSGVMAVGPEVGVARRWLYTVNATVVVRMTDEYTGTAT